jgi:hypothetical protein
MAENHEPAKERRLGRIGELGPTWITAIAALIVALSGAGFFVGHVTASSAEGGSTPTPSTTPTLLPTIRIQSPAGGDKIPMSPVVTGIVRNLIPDEVVWSFNEPYSTGRSPALSGIAYPDAGPCRVNGISFRCNLVFAGEKHDYCRQVRLWVAVVSVNQANDDANIKSGTTGNTFISLRENRSPPHIANAIDDVHVQRYPRPGKSC